MKADPSESPREETRDNREPLVIGWKERLDFPEWHLRRVRAKVDTGARTSALDVQGYDLCETDDAGLVARLRLALDPRHPERVSFVQTAVLKMVMVSNTGGSRERRPLVETVVRLGPVLKRIRLTLTNRAHMRYRMILGREALDGTFVVDVSRKYLLRP